MADKRAGKGFSLPPKAGKDDNSARSKMGKKVQIHFEASLEHMSPKSNGNVNPPVSKGDQAKSGNGDKAARGAKNSKTKTPGQEFNVEKELPKRTKCLMDCEAADILQGIQEKMVILSADSAIKMPIGLTYAKRRGIPSDAHAQTVRQILQPLKKYGIPESTLCMVANLKVESADEACALVPFLKNKKGELRGPLTLALDEIAKLER